jgi:hypothetical protein
MRRRFVLSSVAALLAGVIVGVPGLATASLPSSGTTPVPVTAGNQAGGIDAHLKQLGAIGGKITSVAGGTAVTDALVSVYTASGTASFFDVSDGTGHYQVNGLKPGTYKVCVSGQGATGGGSATGYLSRCWKTAAWNGHSAPPTGAIGVSVTAATLTPNINVALPTAAAIAGRVTNSAGTALKFVQVVARNRNSGFTFYTSTATNGSYKLRGLPAASKGYTVCFNAAGVSASTGYLNECWNNVAWGTGAYPSTAKAVSVQIGKTHANINASLSRGGAIAGNVTDAKSGKALGYASVAVYTTSGRVAGYASANSTGHYTAKSLRAGKYYVCAYPFSKSTATAETDYKGKCFKNVAWSGHALPTSGLTAVAVHTGQTHTGVNLALGKTVIPLGSVAGTILSGVDGTTPIQSAQVTVYRTNGSSAGFATTSATGAYKITGLRANSTGYVVCALAPYGFTISGSPTYGWAPHCYNNRNWDGSSTVPTADKFPLSAGQQKSGINVTLPVGGSIAGAASVFGTANDAEAFVSVYNATTHKQVASGFANGPYAVSSLAGGYSYIVCFDGRFLAFGNTPYGSAPQCYPDVPWNGIP